MNLQNASMYIVAVSQKNRFRDTRSQLFPSYLLIGASSIAGCTTPFVRHWLLIILLVINLVEPY